MQPHEQTLPPEKDPTHAGYRRVLTLFTILLTLGLLAAALWPAGGSFPHAPAPADPTPPVAAEPDPPAPDPVPPPPVEAPPGPLDPPLAVSPDPPPAPPPLPEQPAGEPSRLVVHGDRSCPQIALTYDAGSGADGTAAILDVLKKHGLKSTFFLTGRWVERYPELARRIADEGHEIANHTYSHQDLTKLSPPEALEEIVKGEAAILAVTGKRARPLFREPYGAFSEAERRLVRKAGYSYSIYWDVDTLDWQFPAVEAIVGKITGKSQAGSIVLMHLNVPDSAVASDLAIPLLQAAGYGVVTVGSLLVGCP